MINFIVDVLNKSLYIEWTKHVKNYDVLEDITNIG